MKKIERFIYVFLLVVLTATLIAGYISNKNEKITAQEAQTVEQDASATAVQCDKETLCKDAGKPVQEKVSGTIVPQTKVKIDLNNGYYLMATLSQDFIALAKNDANVSLDIARSISPYKELIRDQNVASFGDGWTLIKSKGWDSTPGNKVPGNASRSFVKEVDGKIITVTQFDYEGGKYDSEIDEWMGRISYPAY